MDATIDNENRLPSYRPFQGFDCPSGTKEEPCWGDAYIIEEVELDDGDLWTITGCSGHGYHPYIKSNRPEDVALMNNALDGYIGILRVQCERCQGDATQPQGCWDGHAYAAPAGPCTLCDGRGYLLINKTDELLIHQGTLDSTVWPYW